MSTIKLPPAYTEADQEARAHLMEKLAELDQAYKRAAQPILADLEAIDARYAPQYVLAPEGETKDMIEGDGWE